MQNELIIACNGIFVECIFSVEKAFQSMSRVNYIIQSPEGIETHNIYRDRLF